jgi:hypothetical protein
MMSIRLRRRAPATETSGVTPPSPRHGASALVAASAACLLGVLYAAVSAYWAAGGTALLDSVGGVFQRAGREGSAGLIAVVWVTVLLKLVAATLGIVVVRGQERITPRRGRQLRKLSWGVATLFVLYGGVLSVTGWLVQLGIVSAGASADHEALRWHAYVWDPWFLVWGLLLGVALARSPARRL